VLLLARLNVAKSLFRKTLREIGGGNAHLMWSSEIWQARLSLTKSLKDGERVVN